MSDPARGVPTIVLTHPAREAIEHYLAQEPGTNRIGVFDEDVLGVTILGEGEMPPEEVTPFEAEGLPFVVFKDFPLPRPAVWIDFLEGNDRGVAGFALDRIGPATTTAVDYEAAILAFNWPAYDDLQLRSGRQLRPEETIAPHLWGLSSEGKVADRGASHSLLRAVLLGAPWTVRSPTAPASSVLLDLALDPGQPCRAACLELAVEVLAASRSPLAAGAPDVARAVQAAFAVAASRLTQLLADADKSVRLQAPAVLLSLSFSGFDPTEAIQRRLRQETCEVERSALIMSLGHVGRDARRVEAVLPYLEDPSPLVRACASYAVLGAVPHDGDALATLASVLEAPSSAEERWTELPSSYTGGQAFSDLLGDVLVKHRRVL